MTAPRIPKPTGAQIQAWRDTGYPYKLVAAEMAEWAAGKERGTVLPDNVQFGRDLDVTVSPNTYLRAKRFLVTQGVLEINDGPHYVALSLRRYTLEIRWVLDSGSCVVAEGDGIFMVYSAGNRLSKIFRITPDLKIVEVSETRAAAGQSIDDKIRTAQG